MANVKFFLKVLCLTYVKTIYLYHMLFKNNNNFRVFILTYNCPVNVVGWTVELL